MSYRSLVVLVVSLLCAVPAAAGQTVPGDCRQLQDSGVTLLYTDDAKDLAPRVLQVVVRYFQENPTPAIPPGTAKIRASRDKVLQFIAEQLGMEKPSEILSQAFDAYNGYEEQVLSFAPDIKRLRLWRKETLKQLLSKGTQVPGFVYRASEGQVEYRWFAGYQSSKGPTAPPDDYLPLVILDDSDLTTDEQITRMLDNYLQMRKQVALLISPGLRCSQLAEFSMLNETGLQGPFSKWFTNGASTVIAFGCLKQCIGDEAVKDYRELIMSPEWEPLKPKADLLSWRADDWDKAVPESGPENLADARRMFAAMEIDRLVALRGSDFLPRVFKAITESKVHDDQSVLAAVSKVAHEDIRDRLSTYGKECPDPFRGVAVQGIQLAPCEKNTNGEWVDAGEPDGIVELAAGTKGVALRFDYAVMDPPATLKVELFYPGKEEGSQERAVHTDKLTSSTPDAIEVRFSDHATGPAPDRYRMLIYVNDKLLRGITIRVGGGK